MCVGLRGSVAHVFPSPRWGLRCVLAALVSAPVTSHLTSSHLSLFPSFHSYYVSSPFLSFDIAFPPFLLHVTACHVSSHLLVSPPYLLFTWVSFLSSLHHSACYVISFFHSFYFSFRYCFSSSSFHCLPLFPFLYLLILIVFIFVPSSINLSVFSCLSLPNLSVN